MTTAAQYRAVTERRTLDNTGLDPALVGAVSTSVLLWLNAPIVNGGLAIGWPIASWATATNAVNPAPGTGTTIKLRRRGMWHVVLGVEAGASFTGAFGVSLDAPAATLLNTANPVNGTAGIELGQSVTAPAACVIGLTLAVPLSISDGQAGDAARGVVRFHANNGAGGAAGEAFVDTQVRYRITYVGDLQGS